MFSDSLWASCFWSALDLPKIPGQFRGGVFSLSPGASRRGLSAFSRHLWCFVGFVSV